MPRPRRAWPPGTGRASRDCRRRAASPTTLTGTRRPTRRCGLGRTLLVSYGGRSVQVTVNDRGPYVGGRDLDLSQGAAEYIGLTRAGVDYVEYSHAGGGYDPRYETYPADRHADYSELLGDGELRLG